MATNKKPLVITMKVAAKGGLSIYGLQRMPITLYVGQWEDLLDISKEIRAFIAAHPELVRKAEGVE